MRLKYKNIGTVTKTFHGVKFNPGDTKEVNGYINAKSFIRVDGNQNESKDKSSGNSKQESKPPAVEMPNPVAAKVSTSEAKSDPKPDTSKPEPKNETNKKDKSVSDKDTPDPNSK